MRRKLASWVARLLRPPRNGLAKQPSNAKKPAIPTQIIPIRTTTTAGRIDRILRTRAIDCLRGLCAALTLFPFALLAQPPQAASAFAQGRAAFERQDFAAALTAFEAALAARMDGPAIHYNIGVAAYKLQRYDRATRAFEEAARTDSMAAIAHYNLGLIARAQQDAGTARSYFERVLGESRDERLVALARSALEDIGAPAPASRPIWAAFGSAALGYDDNVTLTSNGQALGVARDSDSYFDGMFAGSVQLDRAWRIDANASYLKYAELHDFDQLGIGTGARYRTQLRDWTTDFGAQLGANYIAGDSFDQRQSLFAQASRTFAKHWSTRARYRLSNIDGADAYEGLEGLRHELSTRLTYTSVGWALTGTYLFELSDFDSAALSATRHQLSVEARKTIDSVWTARASLGYRNSQYDDTSIGTENRFDLSAGVEYAIDDRWTVVAQYSFTDNNSDASEFDYERNRLQVGAEVAF